MCRFPLAYQVKANLKALDLILLKDLDFALKIHVIFFLPKLNQLPPDPEIHFSELF